jgi:hypothetical protein
MLQQMFFVSCLGMIFFTASGADGQPASRDKNYSTYEIRGEATNGLQPTIDVNPSGEGWDIDIILLAQTNFSAHTWLLTTNGFGSRLELRQTDGEQVVSTNADLDETFRLPEQTTASEILKFHPRRGRVYQWWLVGRPVSEGVSHELASFKLDSAFALSSTNDYVLEVTPLIYKVETNEETADLVKFPPIKIKLLPDGEAKKIAE